jgi:hypothetical protein
MIFLTDISYGRAHPMNTNLYAYIKTPQPLNQLKIID